MSQFFTHIKKHQEGQTLVETIVALAFLISGISAAVVLAIGALRVGDNAVNRVFAEQMTQEGIELMRGWRDSTASSNKTAANWEYRNGITATIEFWDWHDVTNLIPNAGDSVTLVMDHRKKFCITSITSGNNPMACPSDAERLRHNLETGFYRNGFGGSDSTASSSVVFTNFRRTMTLTRTLVNTSDPAGPTFIAVTTTVNWKERSRPNTLTYTLREDLYDWL